MWMNYLRPGSLLLLLCCLLMGCNTTRTEWVHRGEWVYRNESTHEIRITGVIISFTTEKFGTLVLSPGETHTVEFLSDGERDIPPAAIGFPLEDTYGERECSITVDGTTTLLLEPDKDIRDRDAYEVEKLGRAHYRFTYTLTDEFADRLLESAAAPSE